MLQQNSMMCTGVPFQEKADLWLSGILAKFQWTEQEILKSDIKVSCHINCEHFIPTTSLRKHLRYCPLLSKGYTKHELDADQSSKFYYNNSSTVVSLDLDENTVRNVVGATGDVPATMNQALKQWSAHQRLCLYEFCMDAVRCTDTYRHQNCEDDVSVLTPATDSADKSDKPPSRLELLAQLRDMKRRRQSYKGKSTHTSKKSHTEVIREVISNQTELLGKIWMEERREAEEKEWKKQQVERRNRSRSPHRRLHSSKYVKTDTEREKNRIKDRYRERGTDEIKHKEEKSADRNILKVKQNRTQNDNDADKDTQK